MACPAFLLDLPSFTICTCVWKVPSHLSSKLCLLFPQYLNTMCPEKSVFSSLSFRESFISTPYFKLRTLLGHEKKLPAAAVAQFVRFSYGLAKTTTSQKKQLQSKREVNKLSIFQKCLPSFNSLDLKSQKQHSRNLIYFYN